MSRKSRLERLENQPYRKEERLRRGTILSPVDGTLFLIIMFLVVIGVMAVFSAGAPEGIRLFDDPIHFAIRHVFFVVIGLLVLIYTSKIDYKKWRKYSKQIGIVVTVLIFATLIPGLGKTSYGSSRWLTFLPIQPSEFASLAMILMLAKALSENKSVKDEGFYKPMMLIGFMILCILKQPNLSITLLLSSTCAAMMLVGGVSFNLMSSGALLLVPFLLMKVHGTIYQMKRITGWLDPWADQQGTGYNLIQSWYAISSGGLFGVGFGQSKQKLFWLPFAHTDFIFSVISEEFGFIGCVILIGLFVAFIHKGFRISSACPDQFGRLVAFGITFVTGIQAFINIAVATGVFPVTGVTLPLISYGGSSFIVTMAKLGILLNISRKRIKRIAPDGQQYAV